MFKVDPRERPNINDLVSRLQEISVARGVNLKQSLNLMDNGKPAPAQQEEEGESCQETHHYK